MDWKDKKKFGFPITTRYLVEHFTEGNSQYKKRKAFKKAKTADEYAKKLKRKFESKGKTAMFYVY